MIQEDTKNLDPKTVRKLNLLIEEKLLIKEQENLNFWIEEINNALLNSDLQALKNNVQLVLERMRNRHKTIFGERREVLRFV